MYKYEDFRQDLFTDEGQRLFLKVRDHTKKLLAYSGAARMDEIIRCPSTCGNSW